MKNFSINLIKSMLLPGSNIFTIEPVIRDLHDTSPWWCYQTCSSVVERWRDEVFHDYAMTFHGSVSEMPDLSPGEKHSVKSGRKIEAIKAYRDRFKYGGDKALFHLSLVKDKVEEYADSIRVVTKLNLCDLTRQRLQGIRNAIDVALETGTTDTFVSEDHMKAVMLILGIK